MYSPYSLLRLFNIDILQSRPSIHSFDRPGNGQKIGKIGKIDDVNTQE